MRLGQVLGSVLLLLVVGAVNAAAQEDPSRVDLAKIVRNPLANTAILQVQPTFNFDVGDNRDTEYVFNLQANIPISLPGDWRLITRTIVPLINEPGEQGAGYTFGTGDIQPTLFLSPPSSKTFIWGIGPVLQFPSASATSLGSGKWEIGPSAAVIFNSGPWQVGAQANNRWSFAGDRSRSSVNEFFIEPLVNYTLPDNWYLTWSPQVTADWTASAGDRWTVPVGAGFGRSFTLGQQSLNLQAEAYYNAVRPAGGPAWSAILTIQLLFVK